MNKQFVSLTDNDSGHVLKMLFGGDVLPGDIDIIVRAKNGTIALVADISELSDNLATGDKVVAVAKNLEGLKAADIAKKDLSNVEILPQNVIDQLVGPQGVKGIDGDHGVDGEIGSIIRVGNTAPSASTDGRAGVDKYIDISTGNFYGITANGSWFLEGNIKGNTGARGPVGLAPEHRFVGTAIQFKNPDNSWGSEINLKGDKGDKGDKGLKGDKGNNGITPRIKNGNWWLEDSDTGLIARGPQGEKGDRGEKGVNFEIETIFHSRAELEGGTVASGKFAIVGGRLPHDHPDFGRLYYRDGRSWQYITDMSVPGAAGIQGPKGDKGDIGGIPDHFWSGTSIKFINSSGNWGSYVNLKGDKGDRGEKGDRGSTPTIANGNWIIDGINVGVARGPQGLKGDKGDVGKTGDRGLKGDNGISPSHQWSGTSLRLTSSNGSWTSYVNLKGAKGDQGSKGDKGDTGPRGNNGFNGSDGDDGLTPRISNGLWYIGNTNTGVRVTGAPGAPGAKGDKGDQGVKGDPGIEFTVTGKTLYITT